MKTYYNNKKHYLILGIIFILSFWLVACNGGEKNMQNHNDIPPVAPSAVNTNKSIYNFSLNGVDGIISGQDILIALPYGSNLLDVVSQFTSDGKVVAIDGISQISGKTVNNFSHPVKYTVVAEDGSSKDYMVTVTVAGPSDKDVIEFWLAGTRGFISGNIIEVTVPYNYRSRLSTLVAKFKTTGKSIKIKSLEQISGDTSNDFSSPIVYSVTAADGSIKDYTVIVHVASNSAKELTSFSLNGVKGEMIGQTIFITMPYNTDLSQLIASFTTDGKTVTVGQADQESGKTKQDFRNPVKYTVTASDGSIKEYTVLVTTALKSDKEFTSFYIENIPGKITNNLISVHLPYNPTIKSSERITKLVPSFTTDGAARVSINETPQFSGVNTINFAPIVTYTVTAADGTTKNYQVKVTVEQSAAKEFTKFQINNSLGQIDSQNNTIIVVMPYGTDLSSLIPSFEISGSKVWVHGVTQESGKSKVNFTHPVSYSVIAQDGTTKTYTVKTLLPTLWSKEFISFSLGGVAAEIHNEIVRPWQTPAPVVIPINLGSQYSANNLVANFITTGARVTLNGLPQVSGNTVDATNGLNYTVTAIDGSTRIYTVEVLHSLPPGIFSYYINGVAGIIQGNIISVTLPYGVSLNNLVANFSSGGKSITVNSTPQISGQTANDFSHPVDYIITDKDGGQHKYTVFVKNALNPTITQFSLSNPLGIVESGIINNNNILLNMPYNTVLSYLTATYTLNDGTEIKVGNTIQQNGKTVNDFTHLVTYTVIAPDGTTKNYLVTAISPVLLPSVTDHGVSSIDIAFAGSANPFVTYQDLTKEAGLEVKTFVAPYGWLHFGNAPIVYTAGSEMSLTTMNGKPYVVVINHSLYLDEEGQVKYPIATVLGYVHNKWDIIGVGGNFHFTDYIRLGNSSMRTPNTYNMAFIQIASTPGAFSSYGEPLYLKFYTTHYGKLQIIIAKFHAGYWNFVTHGNHIPVNSLGASASDLIVSPRDQLPYVVFINQSNYFSVLRFDGNGQQFIGDLSFAGQHNYGVSMKLVSPCLDNILCLAYVDNNQVGSVSVLKFNGTSWSYLGSPGFAAGGAKVSMAVKPGSNIPYIVFSDSAHGNRLSVMKFNSQQSNWVYVGKPGFVSAALWREPKIVFNPITHTPYIAFIEGTTARIAEIQGEE